MGSCVETIIGVDTLGNGKLSEDGMQWEPSNPQYRDTCPSGIRLVGTAYRTKVVGKHTQCN